MRRNKTNRDHWCGDGKGQENDGSLWPNIGRTDPSDSGSSSNSAFNTLLGRMQSLSFRPFQMCVLLWMGAKDFGTIRPLGRHHRRDRRSEGGADFLAQMPGSKVDVAVQVRHWKTPVQRRAVDELWGYMLRRDIPLGLIVTNSSFMERAEGAALEFPGRPIQLVSCRQLCSSMAALELGLMKIGCKWIIDESFFRSVGQLCWGSMIGRLRSCHSLPDIQNETHLIAGFGGEVASPESRPPTWTAWFLVAVAVLALWLMLWLKIGGRP